MLPGVFIMAGLKNKVIGTILIKECLCVLGPTMVNGCGGQELL